MCTVNTATNYCGYLESETHFCQGTIITTLIVSCRNYCDNKMCHLHRSAKAYFLIMIFLYICYNTRSFSATADQVIAKIRNIRAQYGRELKKTLESDKTGIPYRSQWRWFNFLDSFLRSHFPKKVHMQVYNKCKYTCKCGCS